MYKSVLIMKFGSQTQKLFRDECDSFRPKFKKQLYDEALTADLSGDHGVLVPG